MSTLVKYQSESSFKWLYRLLTFLAESLPLSQQYAQIPLPRRPISSHRSQEPWLISGIRTFFFKWFPEMVFLIIFLFYGHLGTSHFHVGGFQILEMTDNTPMSIGHLLHGLGLTTLVFLNHCFLLDGFYGVLAVIFSHYRDSFIGGVAIFNQD